MNAPSIVVALVALLVATVTSGVHAQLTPDRLYYGIGRTIPMSTQRPAGVAGDMSIGLIAPGMAKPEHTAAVVEGKVDLAGLFPVLWTTEDPSLWYAQLFIGENAIGPAVVLQPMVSPERASVSRGPGRPTVTFARDQKVYSGLRAYTDKHVVLETTKGDVAFRLRPDEAPNTAWNFRSLVEGGYYTDILFHRIINRPEQKFVIQVGDPTGTGSGGPGYMIDLEESKLPHAFGVLSMARTNDPNTNGSQVFVCLSRSGTNFLDNSYCSFAEAVSGEDAIWGVANVQTGQGDRPVDESEPRIVRAYLVDAPPYGTGPEPLSASSQD